MMFCLLVEMSGTSKKSLGSGGRKSYKIKFEEKELELAKQKQNFLKLYKMVLDIKEDMGPDEENWKYMMSNFDGDETIDQVMEKAAELLTKVKSGNLALKDGCYQLYKKARDNYRVIWLSIWFFFKFKNEYGFFCVDCSRTSSKPGLFRP